jgi:ATP-dependent helicase Lhr and Lhr-like helicase
MLAATGQIVWIGRGAAGPRDGRVAVFRRENVALAEGGGRTGKGQGPTRAEGKAPEAEAAVCSVANALAADDDVAARLRAALLEQLQRRGACFLMDLQRAAEPVIAAAGLGAAAGKDAFDAALWDLVWDGRITNDTFAPLRALAGGKGRASASGARAGGRGAARRGGLRGFGRGSAAGGGGLAGGRWSLVADLTAGDEITDTERAVLSARMLLERYGIVSREAVAAEGLPGGFGPLYRVLKELETGGQVRRGHFVEGLSGAQFALPGAVERLRSAREDEPPMDGYNEADVRILPAADPANPYGALLDWPEVGAGLVGSAARTGRDADAAPATGAAKQTPKRTAGAWLILVAGKPVLYLAANARQLLSFPASVTDAGNELDLAAAALHRIPSGRRRLLIAHIDGLPALESPLRETLINAGFEPDYDALAPSRFRPAGTGADPAAVARAGPRA